MKHFLPMRRFLLAAVILFGCTFANAQDQIIFTNNVGNLPAYNPTAPIPAIGDANVTVTSTLSRSISVSYKNAAAATTPENAKYAILASKALGTALGKGTGTIEFDVPAGLGTLKYTRDIVNSAIIEPVVYVNGVKKTITTGTPLAINETGVVSIKFANESAELTKGVLILNVEWTDYSATAINDIGAPKVSLFPNPVKNVLNFDSTVGILSVKVYNIAGSIVKTVHKFEGSNIDLSDLANGLYLVSITTVNGITTTHNILKK